VNVESKFGGVPVEEKPESKFGGIPTEQERVVPIQGASIDINTINQTALNNVVTADTEDPEAKQVFEENEQERQMMRELAYKRFPKEVVDSWENNPIGFSEADDFYDWSSVLPGGGIVRGIESVKLLNISQKIENNEEVTPGEQEMLDTFVNRQIEMSVRGMTFGGKFRYYGAPLPAFMVEFAATGGIGKSAQAATLKATEEFAKRSALAKIASVNLGRAARVGAQTTAMVPMQAAKYGELRLGPWNVTDKGQVIFTESKDSPAVSALKAYAYTSVEVASELSGAKLNKYIINPVTKRLKTPLISGVNALPEGLKDALFQAYKKIKPSARVSRVFTAGGWNGMLAELGEERVADILRETLNLVLEEGYTFDDVLAGITPSVDQLLLESSLIATMGGAKSASTALVNILVDKGMLPSEAQETVDNLTATEQEAMLNEELKVETEEEAIARELAEKETLVEDVKEELRTGRQKIRQVILDNYEQLRQGDIQSLIEARNKTVRDLEKRLNKLIKSNTKIAREIAKNGGINVQSIMEEGGFDKPDLITVNKVVGATVFRVNGGMAFDDVTRQMTDLPYFLERQNEQGEVDVADVFNLVSELIENPKKPVNPEIQLQIEQLEREIELESDMSEIELQAYYEKMSQESDPTAELRELETAPLSELQDLVEEVYPTMTQAEFEEAFGSVEDFIESTENQDFPIIDEAIQRQTEAALMGEPVDIAPSESIFRELYYDWFDSLGALADLSKEAKKRGYRTAAGRDLSILYRMYAGVSGMATQMITANTYEITEGGRVNITGQGLKPILEDFDNAVLPFESNKKVREQDLKDYLIARRYWNDLQNKEGVEVTEEQKISSAAILDRLALKYGDALKWFDNTAREIYAYQQRVLRMLVSAGVMSQETYDNITTEHQNYIPFQRVLDQEFGEYGKKSDGKLFTNATLNRVVKRIVGSDKLIKDPIQSIIKNTFRVADLAWQNRVARSIADLAETMPEYIEKMKPPMDKIVLDDGTVTYRPSKIIPKNAIVVMNDGKKEFYDVHPAIIKAIEQMTPEQLGFVSKFLAMPASVLRAGATLIPEFWVRNVLRDQHSALIQSEARPTPIIDPVRGLVSMMGNGKLYNQWMKSGGSFNSYMEPSDNGLAKAQKELLSDTGKVAAYFKNPLKLPYDISLAIEQSVRIGVFNAAKRQGKTDLEAALEARDATLDFSRGGRSSKIINRYIPFFNAGMQGADKLYRSLQSNPKALIMWASATITLPSVLLAGYYLHGAPEEDRKEYLEIPQWQKDMFWVFKADGEWKRYPKPFTLGYIFGSVPERFMNWMSSESIEDGKKFWFDLAKGIVGSLSPVYDPSAVIPPLAKVIIENVSNYNFFQGRDIYPSFLDDLPPEERKAKYTSQTAIEVGKILDVSPALVDNALRGLIAGSADYVTDASDFIINEVRKWNGESIPEKPSSIMDIPVVRAFSMRPPTGSAAQSVQTFYDLAQEAKQIKNKMRDLIGDEREQYRNDNLVIARTLPYIESNMKIIREVNRRRNAVYENLVMTSDEKAKELKRLDDMILDRSRRVLDRFAENMKLHEEGNL
jgi:hypothetical protein